MENNKTNNQASLFTTSKVTLKKIALVCGSIILALLIAIPVIKGVESSSVYQSKVPAAQAIYDDKKEKAKEALQKYCDDWKALSKAKIEDNINGALEENRVEEWRRNLDVKCSEVQAPVGF